MITASPYYHQYIDLVKDKKLLGALRKRGRAFSKFLKHLPDEVWNHRYAEDKWSVKEIVHHVCDCERVFAYRALRIARGDDTPMPGFEQDDYVKNAVTIAQRKPKSLIREFRAIRRTTIQLYRHLDRTEWAREGTASDNPFSVEAIGYIIAGHDLHHQKVIEERYLAVEAAS